MSRAEPLRDLLARPGLITMPCCYDALSGLLVERAGFPLTFMSGFGVAAQRLGLPDTGLISYGEMAAQARDICGALTIPVIGDGDTGYGNAMNVKRTVRGYSQAGLAGIMIEDQLAPKRCGHTRVKEVVDRAEARSRIQAAVDARDEGAEIVIMARTDARQTRGFNEALARCQEFAELGADIIFMEAPETKEEMASFCLETPAPCMANMLAGGKTPLLPPTELEELGYKIVAYPLTLLSCAVDGMNQALAGLAQGQYPDHLSFQELQEIVGFPRYYQEESRYISPPSIFEK
ncbi:MAG: isocitrate lyase/PEP mutase family protein [Thermodesulfobacteriota bacterium]